MLMGAVSMFARRKDHGDTGNEKPREAPKKMPHKLLSALDRPEEEPGSKPVFHRHVILPE